MFWNDPMLYGASFPQRELPNPVQTPFAGPAMLPWQNVPRLVPPFYGQTPFFGQMPFFGQQVPFYGQQTPFFGQQVPPFYGQQTPLFNFVNPYMHTAYNPLLQPYGHQIPQFNIPQMNWVRPFGC